MNARSILLILAAVLITVGTGYIARSWLINQRTQLAQPAAAPQPVQKTHVLVAESNLPAGSFLKEQNFRWQAWPDEAVPENYMIQGEVELVELTGAVARRAFTAGEPITRSLIVKPGERGFLAAVLRPGYRAVALQVNATSAIAGLVFPGDRVDIIITYLIEEGLIRSRARERHASETILTNVRILAIDQEMENPDGTPRVGKNATFEVTPKQAEMISMLREMGRLSLALRPLAKDEEELKRIVESGAPIEEPDPTQGETYTLDTEVSNLLNRLYYPPRRQQEQSVRVVRGNQAEKTNVRQ
jgi:pilus assembly protein CpaB